MGSGSTGNATLIEARQGEHVQRALVDCGLGLRALEDSLAQAGVLPAQLDAIFITHEHADHVGCALAFAKKHGRVLLSSAGTARAARLQTHPLWHAMADGQAWQAGSGVLAGVRAQWRGTQTGLLLQPFTVPHDASEPLQLRAQAHGRILGILTDLGHATEHVVGALSGCHALLLECNHDPELLAQSTYPPSLRKRVTGNWGHLTNAQSATLLARLAHPEMHTVVAAHLSQQNNRPELAHAALSEALARCGSPHVHVLTASATQGSDWISV